MASSYFYSSPSLFVDGMNSSGCDIYRFISNQKISENRPPPNMPSDSKTTFEIFKNQKSNSKKTPLSSKKSKTYIRRPQIKKFYKTDPPKNGNSDSKYNSKFS